MRRVPALLLVLMLAGCLGSPSAPEGGAPPRQGSSGPGAAATATTEAATAAAAGEEPGPKPAVPKSDRAQEVFQAIWNRNLARLQSLLDSGADPDAPLMGSSTMTLGSSVVQVPMFALSSALTERDLALSQKQQVLAMFVKAGADVNVHAMNAGPALCDLLDRQTIDADVIECVRALFAAGADPDLPSTHQYLGTDGKVAESVSYPLPSVVLWRKLPTATKAKLIEAFHEGGADMNGRDGAGQTLLYALAAGYYQEADSEALIPVLLACGAEANALSVITHHYEDGSTEEQRETALLALLRSRDLGTERQVRLIGVLARAGADLDARTADGITPLYGVVAGWYGTTGAAALAKALLAAGARPDITSTTHAISNDKPVSYQRLPAFAVLDTRNGFNAAETADLMRAFLAAGLDPNAGDDQDDSLLKSLVYRSELPEYLDLLRAAVRSGGDPGRPDEYGSSVLTNAFDIRESLAKKGTTVGSVIDALLSGGAGIDSPDGDGTTLLMHAAGDRDIESASWLISRGASAMAATRSGETALHALFDRSGDPPADLVRLLASHGANLNARTASGRTATYLAATSDETTATLQLLVELGADPNIGDEDGVAPLGAATQRGCRKNMALLSSKKAVAYSFSWPTGNADAVSKAMLSGDPAKAAGLGAEALSKIVSRTQDGVPSTPLHLAADQGAAVVVAALCAQKVDWNVRDRYGRAPVQVAVLRGRSDVVTMLLDAGADANLADNAGESAFSRALELHPEMASAMLSRGVEPKGSGAAWAAISTGNLEALASCDLSRLGPEAVSSAASLGDVAMTELLASRVAHPGATVEELVQKARESRAAFDAYRVEAAKPLEAPRKAGGISQKRGSFTWIVESWSPWMAAAKDQKLSDYPVGVYVPKDYDGSKPFGLLVSMIHAQSANQYPRAEFQAVLDRRHVLWVGFDPYNGIFVPFEDNHETFSLAIVYNMLSYFNVDRSRIYMAGFSWGGRLTGEIVPKQARIFSGGIAIGGCFTTGGRIAPALDYGRENVTMVMATGDWDYNRQETYGGWDVLTYFGYRNCTFLQESGKGHAIMSAANFEKAMTLLDAGAAARAARAK